MVGLRQPAPSTDAHHGPTGSLSRLVQPLPHMLTPPMTAPHESRHVHDAGGGATTGGGGGEATAGGGKVKPEVMVL